MKAKYLILVGLMNLILPCAYANPVIDHVAAGKVEVAATASHLHVQQSTPQAIVNWQSFNIAQHESVHFQQPPQGIALNRIDAHQGASEIAGRLSATGNIILSNAAGIHFGSTAQVDVAGLIATTANISDRNFLSGNYTFEDNSGRNASVTNAGTINAREHGFVALMAPHVANTGRINAHLGQVAQYSTTQFTMNFNGNELVHFAVDADTIDHAVKSKSLKRDNGKVAVSAKTAKKVLDNVIKLAPGSEANFVHVRGDTIILSAKDDSYGKMVIDPSRNNIVVGVAHTEQPHAAASRRVSGSDSDSDYEMVSPQPLSPISDNADADYHFIEMPVVNNPVAANPEYTVHMSVADGIIRISENDYFPRQEVVHNYPEINHVYRQPLATIVEEEHVPESRPVSAMSMHSGLSSDSDASHLSQWSSDSEVELLSGSFSFLGLEQDSPSRPASPLSNASSYVDLADLSGDINLDDMVRPASVMSMNDDLPSRPASAMSNASSYVDLASLSGESSYSEISRPASVVSRNDDLPSRPVSAMSNASSYDVLSGLSSESSYIDISRPASVMSEHDEMPASLSPSLAAASYADREMRSAPLASRLSGESDFSLLSDLSGESSYSDVSRPASVISMYSDESVTSEPEISAAEIAYLLHDFSDNLHRADALEDYGIGDMFAMNPPAPIIQAPPVAHAEVMPQLVSSHSIAVQASRKASSPKPDLTPIALNPNASAPKPGSSHRAVIPAVLSASALAYSLYGGHEVVNSPFTVNVFKHESTIMKHQTFVHPYAASIGDSLLNKFKRMSLPKCYTVQPNPVYQYEYFHCNFDDQNQLDKEV
jgi:filamentous hemagglutinin family protein